MKLTLSTYNSSIIIRDVRLIEISITITINALSITITIIK